MISEDVNSLDFHLKRHLNIVGLNAEEVPNFRLNKFVHSRVVETNMFENVELNSESVVGYLQQEVTGNANTLTAAKIQKYKFFLEDVDNVSSMLRLNILSHEIYSFLFCFLFSTLDH